MGGGEDQELNHMMEVVPELLVQHSIVINASDPPLQLLHDLVISHGVHISTDTLPLWVMEVVVPPPGSQECGEL